MNPANGPKARLVHMYIPPSSGYFHESHITATETGTNIAAHPMSQTGSDVGPAAAAVATHVRFVQTITKNSATSNRVRLRRKFIGYTISNPSFYQLSRCLSAMEIVQPPSRIHCRDAAQLHPALLRLSAMISH